MKMVTKNKKIAILIPCFNEEVAIAKVVADFKKYVPEAKVYVYDNNSTDKTAEKALKAGAIVRSETLQGKGNVVRRMFADIDADVYVMSDGDETYDIKRTPDLIAKLIDENLDMVVGARKEVDLAAYRVGHRTGNIVLTKLVQKFFKHDLMDMLSGFRVFSRRFVKSFPAQSAGFEIETELTVHALSSRIPMAEVETDYFARPLGSESKLATYKDGARILLMIINLIKDERPMLFFNVFAAIFFVFSLWFGIPVIEDFWVTHQVLRFPSAFLAMGLMILSVISMLVGLVLDSVAKSRKEVRRMAYLNYPTVGEK